MGTDLAGQHRDCEERLARELAAEERSKRRLRRVWLIMPCIIRDPVAAIHNRRVERCLFLFLVPAGMGGEIQAGKKGSHS